MKKIVTLIVVIAILTIGLAACSSAPIPVPENTEDKVSVGDGYMVEEKYEEAAEAYKEELKTFPDSPELHKKLAESYLLLGDLEQGNKYLDQLSKLYEESGDGEGLAWVTKMRNIEVEKLLALTGEQREYLDQLITLAMEKDYENLYTSLGLDSFPELFKNVPLQESTQTYELVYATRLVGEEVIFTLEETGDKVRSFNFGDELEGETYYIYYNSNHKNNLEETDSYPALVTHFYTSKGGVGEGAYYYYAYTPESKGLILLNNIGQAVKGIREGEEVAFLEYADGRLEEIILTYKDGFLQLPEGEFLLGEEGKEPERGRVGRQADGGDVVYLP